MQSEETCMSCLRVVSARQEALLCDGCARWQQKVCETGMSNVIPVFHVDLICNGNNGKGNIEN